jgi:hypothetical protein
MGKVKRKDYLFIWSLSDHAPAHVHIYKKRRLILRWNLENWVPLSGVANKKIIKLLRQIFSQGVFDEILKNKKCH